MKNLKNETDKALINFYLSGRNEGLMEIYNRYYKDVLSITSMRTYDQALAEDLTQDTFIKAIQALKDGKYSEEGSMKQWLCRIAFNLFIDYHRRNSKKLKGVISLTDNIEDFEKLLYILPETDSNQLENMIHAEKDLDINKLLEGLPAEQKEIILLRHFHNFSFKEIAEYTGESINTCLGRMRYALKNIRIQLGLPAVIEHE